MEYALQPVQKRQHHPVRVKEKKMRERVIKQRQGEVPARQAVIVPIYRYAQIPQTQNPLILPKKISSEEFIAVENW